MKSLLVEPGGQAFQLAWASLRIGMGILFIIHGYPKMMGGVEKWDWLGQQMSLAGIRFWPRFWGFLAAAAELVGGLLLVAGLFTRVAALSLLGTMVIALIFVIKSGQSYDTISHPLKCLLVFAAFAIAGGGKYALDRLLSLPIS